MKVTFTNNREIRINGNEVGQLSPSSEGCYVYLGAPGPLGVCIARFGKYKGMAGGIAEAKRWLKLALVKAGSAARLVLALQPDDVSPLDFQKMPLPRRTAKTIRMSVRLEMWARREMIGKPISIMHGDKLQHEFFDRGTLTDVMSEGFEVKLDDGSTRIFSHQTTQAIFPN